MIRVLLISLLFINCFSPPEVKGHPQCLDFEPPFRPNMELKLCSRYQNYSCCADDDVIMQHFRNISIQLQPDDYQKCARFIRDILCQKCSPYAAHAYGAESDGRPSKFPIFCSNYYVEMMRNCEMLNDTLLQFANGSSDSVYCFPHILNHSNLLGGFNSDLDGCIQLCVRRVIGNIYTPTSAKHAGDGSNRFFVAEQRGIIWAFTPQFSRIRGKFLDLRNRIFASGRVGDERGLLDFTFHPDFRRNRKFYVYYTSAAGKDGMVIRISEFHVNSKKVNQALKSSERIIMEIEEPEANHNGGTLLFHESFLYIFTGDGGGAGDPHNNSQNLGSLLGKALRIDVDSPSRELPYGIPHDNPFIERAGARDEVYAYGLRNPWRCSVDRGDRNTGEGRGRIFCGDVGQDELEEINIIVKGGNYGWNGFEGSQCFNKKKCNKIRNHIPPISEYNHTTGLSVTGGLVYRGCGSPNLQGHYIYGDWFTGKLYSLRKDGDRWIHNNICMGDEEICKPSINGDNLSHIRTRFLPSIAEDEQGELYLIQTMGPSMNLKMGVIYQLVDPTRRGNPREDCTTTPTQHPTTESRVAIIRGTTTTPSPTTTSSGYYLTPKTTESTTTTTTNSSLVGRDYEFRLVNQFRHINFVGRIELRETSSARWGVLCTFGGGWTQTTADVICRHLGYQRAHAIYNTPLFGKTRLKMKLAAPLCDDNTTSFSQCSIVPMTRVLKLNCRSSYASVYCKNAAV